MNHQISLQPTWRSVVKIGVRTTLALALGYAVVCLTIFIVRTSLTILSASDGHVDLMLLSANAFTLAWVTLVFTATLILIAVPVGVLTAAVLKLLLPRLNPRHLPLRAAVLGLSTGLVFYLIIHLLLQALGTRLTLDYPETYRFWFALPALLYIAACTVETWKLNARYTLAAIAS